MPNYCIIGGFKELSITKEDKHRKDRVITMITKVGIKVANLNWELQETCS